MKLFIKFLMFVVVLGVAGLFFIKKPDGAPWLTASAFIPDVTPIKKMLASVKRGSLTDASQNRSGKTQVYRWQDKDGNWQYSDQPPAVAKADEIWIDPDTNMIQGLAAKTEVEAAKSPAPSIPLPMTVAPSQVGKLMDDAKAVSALMDKRNKEIETLSDGAGRK
jgi:hypothetical protein